MMEDEDMEEMDIGDKRDSGTPSASSSMSSTTPTISPEPDNEKRSKAGNTKVTEYLLEEYVPPSRNSTHDLSHTYSWSSQLAESTFVAAPVSSFGHAPMSDGWDNILVEMKVEVENTDTDPIPGVFSTAYWVASVIRIQGYKVLLRYEGFGQDGSKDFWMNLCSEGIHPVGWCATKGKPLIPPKTIQHKYQDWKHFLVKRLTGARTLPTNFYKVVHESVQSVFKVGMKLEVVDKMRISQVRVASVVDITGRRLQLSYDEGPGDGFWCHEESPLIHPVGWARRVGHQISASQAYHDRCMLESYLTTDSTADMFPEYRQPPGQFKTGMKVEAVDPLNLATVCVASVMKVLRHGYIMIRMDGYETDPTGGDWFCYHGSSPFIFPPGFCERNNIKLKPPAGFPGDFSWVEYLKTTKSEAAPMVLFSHKENTGHNFRPGMKLECTDLMDPRLVCVSTVSKVVGRLLKVHFDGWEEDYDQWMDCESVDMYPVGWCELVGHRLEGPRMKIPLKKKEEKKKRKQGGNKRTIAKSRKKGTNQTPGADNEETSGDLESRSPTPTPPVLEPEVPINQPQEKETEADTNNDEAEPADIEEAVEDKNDESEAEPVEEEAIKYIPRLLDADGNATPRSRDQNLEPSDWSVQNVTAFLEVNECSNHVHNFAEQKIDGMKFLTLTKQEIMSLVNNKMGPCLKIEHLQKLLKDRLSPAQTRLILAHQKK